MQISLSRSLGVLCIISASATAVSSNSTILAMTGGWGVGGIAWKHGRTRCCAERNLAGPASSPYPTGLPSTPSVFAQHGGVSQQSQRGKTTC
ncbi:hypothetical protein B0J12DRAFT_690913 [Macrophomina phaseolina]|uniref:Secreted protein n=1 Tax=Macrophomina phaseolina TaxID=35725 RepID=A0ABQ8FQB4_9PEZI|nr:hypothetical protein B0J12DRAFT_690913 [Macrophomina phaseolina]